MFLFAGLSFSQDKEYFEKEKRKMIERHLKPRGITDPRILEAMYKVPREEFIPQNLRRLAYSDGPLPIGEGQTISQPYIVALMTSLLEPKKTDKILEIGTGSGYQAAVLSLLVDKVYTIEIIKKLAQRAQDTLKRLGYDNVEVKWGDGFLGWEENSPFDGIIITCSVDDFPPKLIEQLKEGGRIVAPINNPFGYQDLVVGIKRKGEIIRKYSIPCRFVPATHRLR